FAQTLYGVNTFQLRRRPVFAANVPDSVWRAWRRRPRIKFSDAEAVTAALTMPVVTAWPSDDNGSVFYCGKEGRDSQLGAAGERCVVVPAFAPAQSLVNPPGVVDALLVKARSEVEMREAMEVAEGVMRSRRHLRPNQDNNFVLDTSEGVQRFWSGISRILVVVL